MGSAPGTFHAPSSSPMTRFERFVYPIWPQAFSLHSYGKNGLELQQLGNSTTIAVAGARPAPAAASPATLGFAVTEHQAHTTLAWNALATNGDTNFEASRLAAQILFMAQNGWDSYVFKVRSSHTGAAADAPGPRHRKRVPTLS